MFTTPDEPSQSHFGPHRTTPSEVNHSRRASPLFVAVEVCTMSDRPSELAAGLLRAVLLLKSVLAVSNLRPTGRQLTDLFRAPKQRED